MDFTGFPQFSCIQLAWNGLSLESHLLPGAPGQASPQKGTVGPTSCTSLLM